MSFYILEHEEILQIIDDNLETKNIEFLNLEMLKDGRIKVNTSVKRELSSDETIKIKDNLILLSRGEIGFSSCCTIIVEIVGVEHKEKIWDSLSKYDKNQMRFLEFWALLLKLVES